VNIDERLLKDALTSSREAVAVELPAAQGGSRFVLLRLKDALDRLLFVLAGDAPTTKHRGWRGDKDAVDIGGRLEDAHRELVVALRDASAHIDPSLRASLEKACDDLVVLIAHVVGVGRGGEGPRAVAPPQPAAPATGASGPGEAGTPTAALEGGVPTPEQVSFSAAAPAQARPDDEFVARLAAYLREDEESTRAALARAAPRAQLSVFPKSKGLLRGTEVEVVLEASGLTIDGHPGRAERRLIWDGKPQIAEFDVHVPADTAPRTLVLKFYVRLAGVVLERIPLELEIKTGQAAKDARWGVAPDTRLPATAFASYSSLDRPRVLDRVAAIRIAAGLDVFLDCMDLNPSEEWEPRLSQEIDQRDLFILFWSKAAAQSRWVTWEWERALAAKGLAAMQIQPLENGVRPPSPLRGVHVADPYVDLRGAELARREPTR